MLPAEPNADRDARLLGYGWGDASMNRCAFGHPNPTDGLQWALARIMHQTHAQVA